MCANWVIRNSPMKNLRSAKSDLRKLKEENLHDIEKLKEQNSHDIDKLMKQHEIDIDALKEQHKLELEKSEKEHQYKLETMQKELDIHLIRNKKEQENAFASAFAEQFGSALLGSVLGNEAFKKGVDDKITAALKKMNKCFSYKKFQNKVI